MPLTNEQLADAQTVWETLQDELADFAVAIEENDTENLLATIVIIEEAMKPLKELLEDIE